MNKLDATLHLAHYLTNNAENFPNKIWLKDDDLAINWLETVIATEKIVDFLEAILPVKNQENRPQGIVVRGDCGALHVLALIAILVSDFVYVPENRTLRRDSETSVLSEYPVLVVDKGSITVVDISVNRLDKILTKKELFDDAAHGKAKPKKLISFSLQNAPSAFFYTSGSTGTPKIIVIPHSNLIRGAQFVSKALALTSDDIIAGTLTLDFDYGVNQVLNTIINCATYICCPFSSPNKFWTEIARSENCTIIPAMPFLIEKYFIGTQGSHLPKVRLVTSSGGPFLDQHKEQVMKLCPETNISPMYGLSEGFRATILPEKLFSAYPTSVGFPIGDTEIQVRDSEFRPLSNNCEGEIWQASGCVSWGYFCDIASTREKFILDETYPNKIWIRSGDLGYLDENGLLYIVGRITHQIKRFGIRISINEVERAYLDLPGVDQCVVIPLTKNSTESDIGVIVVGKNLTSEILTQLEKQVPVELRASKIRITDFIPGNYNEGKPDRELLRKEHFQL
jgi:acyl-CoA synthetase (AMP-forming)/AMP-acid ligase II